MFVVSVKILNPKKTKKEETCVQTASNPFDRQKSK